MDCKDRARVEARRRLGGASCNHPHGRLAVTLIKVVRVGPERSEWAHDMFCRDCMQDVKCNFLQRSVKLNGKVCGRP